MVSPACCITDCWPWQAPQVAAMFLWLTLEAGSLAGRIVMNVAMAVDATRGLLVAGGTRLGMQSVIVRLLLVAHGIARRMAWRAWIHAESEVTSLWQSVQLNMLP